MKEREHGRLWFGKPDDRWSISDPTDDLNAAAQNDLYRAAWHNQPTGPDVTVNLEQLRRVLRMAGDFAHLGTYELGTKVVCRQLADLRALLRRHGRAR